MTLFIHVNAALKFYIFFWIKHFLYNISYKILIRYLKYWMLISRLVCLADFVYYGNINFSQSSILSSDLEWITTDRLFSAWIFKGELIELVMGGKQYYGDLNWGEMRMGKELEEKMEKDRHKRDRKRKKAIQTWI